MNRSSRIVVCAAIVGLPALFGAVVLWQTMETTATAPPRSGPSSTTYSAKLTQLCAGALLFEGTHTTGTRAGAIAVARDIRASGLRRLRRVDAVAKPANARQRAQAWIELERRLVELYAGNYLRIWFAIERAETRAQRERLPIVLRTLLDEPRRLERRAAALEEALGVPDCTGGSATRRAESAIS